MTYYTCIESPFESILLTSDGAALTSLTIGARPHT